MFENVGEIVLLFWRTLRSLPFAWQQRRKIFDQFFEIGNASLLMVCILSFFIGGVLSLQIGPFLAGKGFRVLRFNNLDVMTNRICVLEAIAAAVLAARAPSLPSPASGGGGGARGTGGDSQ